MEDRRLRRYERPAFVRNRLFAQAGYRVFVGADFGLIGVPEPKSIYGRISLIGVVMMFCRCNSDLLLRQQWLLVGTVQYTFQKRSGRTASLSTVADDVLLYIADFGHSPLIIGCNEQWVIAKAGSTTIFKSDASRYLRLSFIQDTS